MAKTRCLKSKWPGSIADTGIIVFMKCISDKKYMNTKVQKYMKYARGRKHDLWK